MGCIGIYEVLCDWPLGPFKGSHGIMHGLGQFEVGLCVVRGLHHPVLLFHSYDYWSCHILDSIDTLMILIMMMLSLLQLALTRNTAKALGATAYMSYSLNS